MPSKQSTGGDAARRAGRTGVQGGAVFLAITGYNLFAATPLTAEQTQWAMLAGALIVSFLQNLLEEQHVLPEMFKGKPDLDDRKLEALAAAIGSQHDDIERLENAIRDLRADAGSAPPEDPARISTRQLTPEAPFRG